MKSNTLISVRSNCNFNLDYETGILKPSTEVILLTTFPKYVVNEDENGITKETGISEFRFLTDVGGINNLIGQLQLVLQNMVIIDQNAAGINTIIQASKK